MNRRSAHDVQTAVTPVMIEAGLRALEEWKALLPGELLAKVHRAMAAHAPAENKGTNKGAAAPSPTVLDVLKRLGR